ncbi:hypothetical protein D3C87_997300 [compost metagenome]
MNLRRIRNRLAAAPLRDFAGTAHGFDRLPLITGDHRQIVAVADHLDHASQRFDGRRVECLQRAARTGRADHPRMQHARQAHVLDEGCTTADLRRNVEARQRMADQFEISGGHRR